MNLKKKLKIDKTSGQSLLSIKKFENFLKNTIEDQYLCSIIYKRLSISRELIKKYKGR